MSLENEFVDKVNEQRSAYNSKTRSYSYTRWSAVVPEASRSEGMVEKLFVRRVADDPSLPNPSHRHTPSPYPLE